MKCSEIAKQLMKTPDAEVLLKVSNDWVEVQGVKATGQHRNGVTFEVVADMGGMGGVIVVPEDGE